MGVGAAGWCAVREEAGRGNVGWDGMSAMRGAAPVLGDDATVEAGGQESVPPAGQGSFDHPVMTRQRIERSVGAPRWGCGGLAMRPAGADVPLRACVGNSATGR